MPRRRKSYCNSLCLCLLFDRDLSVAPWQKLGLSEVSLTVEVLATTLKDSFRSLCPVIHVTMASQ